MIGDKTRNSAEGHQLSFLAFTRAYLCAVASEKKPYGLAQDYQGKEAKAAKKNPYFYSHLDQEFFDILREVMPKEYLYMVDNMETGWKKWETTKETVTLPEPFSGNVSQQGIGSARFLMDFANGERTFGILAGDKMGPAGINRPIREGVYAALNAGEFINGLVFEIWDAKAFDENGNIPLDKLPTRYADVQDAVNELKDKADQEFVRSCYGEDGLLKKSFRPLEEIKGGEYVGREDIEHLAALLKKAGYVPTERIFLDAEKDKKAVYDYLADSDRFNIKQVWAKKNAGWDINRFQNYLLRPILGSSVTKLGILAGGEYVGKDDPVMVGSLKLMEHIYKYVENNPILLQGDMNGSHWLGAIPTKFKYAVSNVDSHPILVGLRYTVNNLGKIVRVEDVFSSRKFDGIRKKMFKFNFFFKWIASLGGQFAPYGTDVRTVEASYPLAKFLRQLQDPASPFLIRNKPLEVRETMRVGKFNQRRQLFEAATPSLDKVKKAPIATPFKAIKDELPLRAEYFKANLIRILTEHPDESFFFGADTDIGKDQQAQLMPIHKAVREIEGLFPNLITGAADGATLATRIRQLQDDGALKLGNTFIVAQKANLDKGIFKGMRGKGKAWITAIDDSAPGVYLPIFEAATLTIMSALKADAGAILDLYNRIADEPMTLDEFRKILSNRLIYLIPKATKVNLRNRRILYELAAQLHHSL
ncbi:MAG: fructose 1,6-bisphosphatase [Candidatus Omnitrophica bacterium]|nr:fructose 1,6-bisphosphatase [Candidatus Omnitrophota bacterium]